MDSVLQKRYVSLLQDLRKAAEQVYGDRLVSLAVFGSVGRGVAVPESDIDILVVAERLPQGRISRVREFERVEQVLARVIPNSEGGTPPLRLSPVFKTPEELRVGSPLFLDMIEDAVVLTDRDRLFQRRLESLKRRLEELGARRVRQGDRWYWDLKPDYRPGEVFEL